MSEKELVRVPDEATSSSAKLLLANNLLVEKLITALRRIGAEHKGVHLDRYLEKEVMDMFAINNVGSVQEVSKTMNISLKKFQDSVEGKFSKLEGWGTDHNVMLKSFIDERFQLANVIKSMKKDSEKVLNDNNINKEHLVREKNYSDKMFALLMQFNQLVPRSLNALDSSGNKELVQSFKLLLAEIQRLTEIY